MTKLFTKEFLDVLSEQCGAISTLNHYMDDLGMNFHDAITRLANFHGLTPEYCEKGYCRPLSQEAKKYLYDLYDKNESQKDINGYSSTSPAVQSRSPEA